MLSDFFQVGPIPDNQMIGMYNYSLVILSYIVAVFASYIALDFTGRLRDISNTKASTLMWLIGGSIAMGAGIWSMHFIGMLSFSMPMMAMHYNSFWTMLSMIIAILASLFALILLKSKVINIYHLAAGGVILGLAIASMHYTGMEAMKSEMNLRYLPDLFMLSIIIAIIASEAALWLALKSNQVVRRMQIRIKIVSALIMGAAICGMHYTGMAATIFTPLTEVQHSMNSIDQGAMALSIAGVTFVILCIAFFASTYKDAINEDKLTLARQLGMAEVAASVLHNVGNVLNSINVSAELVADKIAQSKLQNLENLSKLLYEHKHDLTKFITEDTRAIKIPDYLHKITEHWHNEFSLISNEMSILIKNIRRIVEIVSIQQELSKNIEIEQTVSIEEILDETLLITGLNNNKNIIVKKKYQNLKPILIDKIKLSQILINIITNAKDALKESSTNNKLLILNSYVEKNNNFVVISIVDNGIGILPEHIKKIFMYGFTTKKSGHGFGMHTSALAISHMGGSISVTSDGLNKGATFTLKLPYKSH